MGSFSLSGGVEVFGFISPSNTTDQYPVIDPLYGIDGLRNVNTLSDLNLIPTLRRRAGMIVGVSGGTTYYKLNSPPWSLTLSDWSIFNSGSGGDFLPLSGGTVSGGTIFTNGLSANTISATTYFNLPKDIFVTGGTYSGNTIIFTNNSGGTFNVTGITSSSSFTGGTITGATIFTNGVTANTFSAATYLGLPSDIYVSGFTYLDNTLTIERSSGNPNLFVTINDFTGLTINGDLNVTGNTIVDSFTANTISATTYENLPIDIRVTGGTYSLGTATFTNNTGGTFNVTGFYTGNTDNYITGGTFDKNTETLTLTDITGGTISISGFSDVFVTGGTFSGGSIVFTNNSGGTFNVSGISSFDTFVTGFSYSDNTFTISQNSGTTFSATIDSVTGLTVNGTLNSTTFSGGTYFGDGSNLTGIIRGSGGGRVFYFNLSNTQTPYYEFSPSATTQPEQSITTSVITSGSTSTIAGFLTPPNVPNVTAIVGGVWTFFVHSYKEDNTSDFDIFCEVYKRTTGGTEIFLFQTDPIPITSVSPIPSMEITDGYFSGTSLDITDRLLIKVNVTNLGLTSKTVTLVTEGNIHYSYSTSALYIPVVDTFTTGFTYNNNTLTIQRNEGLSDLSVSINSVTGLTINGDLDVTGTTSSGTISATTYQNLPTDIRVTGGTYSNGTATFTNNTGGTFNVGGFFTGSTDVFVTGGTYSNGTTTFTNNTGGTFNVVGFFTGYTNVVNSVTAGIGLSGDTTTGDITLINTSPDQIVTISGGTGITTGGTYPDFTITNSLPDQVVTLSEGTNISITGTYPNFNISVTGSTTFDYGKSYAISNSYQLI